LLLACDQILLISEPEYFSAGLLLATFHPFQVPFPVISFALFIQKIQVYLVAELATIIEVVKTD
jgi:hypothetical protein